MEDNDLITEKIYIINENTKNIQLLRNSYGYQDIYKISSIWEHCESLFMPLTSKSQTTDLDPSHVREDLIHHPTLTLSPIRSVDGPDEPSGAPTGLVSLYKYRYIQSSTSILLYSVQVHNSTDTEPAG